MASIGSLLATFGLDHAGFDEGIKRVDKRIDAFRRSGSIAFSKFNRAAGNALTAVAAASAAAFTIMVKNTIDYGEKLDQLSDRLGISAEAMSGLRYAAEQNGITFETLTMGLQRMIRRIGEAAVGTGEAEVALLELGLSAQKLAQLRPENQFRAIAKALSEVGNAGDKARLAQKLFDSEGVSLLQMMSNGADGIDEYTNKAEELGIILSTKTAEGAAQAKLAIGNAKAAMNAAALEATINLIPAINDLSTDLGTNIPKGVNVAIRSFMALRVAGLDSLAFLSEGWSKIFSIIAKAESQYNKIKAAQEKDKLAKAQENYLAYRAIAVQSASDNRRELRLAESYGKQANTAAKAQLKERMDAARSSYDEAIKLESRKALVIGNILRELESEYKAFDATADARLRKQLDEQRIASEEELQIHKEKQQKILDMVNHLQSNLADIDSSTGIAELSATLSAWSSKLRESSEEAELLGKKLTSVQRNVAEIPIAEGINNASAGMKKMTRAAAEARAQMAILGETMRVDIFDSSQSMFVQMRNQWTDTIKQMINEWVSSGIIDMISGLGNSGSNSSSKGGNLFGSAMKLFGFARGGSFEVGGQGGTDSNLVAFKATRGEEVSIKTRGQQESGGGGGGVTVINNIDARGADAGVEQRIQQAVTQSSAATVAHVKDMMKRRRLV
jgi:hypothetical protein